LSSFARVDENEREETHLIVTCTLHDQGNVIKSHALIDCGATRFTFIDNDYAHCYHLSLHLLISPRNLTVINEIPVTSAAITHIIFGYNYYLSHGLDNAFDTQRTT
jgi:predicted aspartyl protease